VAEPAPVKRPKAKLKESDVKKLREMLHQERQRIIEEMRILDDRSLTANMEEGANQQPGFSLQLADSASDNMQVETDLGIRSIEAEQLIQIDDALRALATGDYGICQRCNEPISIERLFARPNAKYCISCLKLLESGKA
jgi:DnaK suppressor protein